MSFRLKLLILNSIIVFGGLFLSLQFMVQRTQSVFLSSIDKEMLEMGNELTRQRPPRGPGDGGGGPAGEGPDGGREFINPGQGQGRGPRFFQGPGGPFGRAVDRLRRGEKPEQAEGPPMRGDDIRRPVLFDADGKPFWSSETRQLDPKPLTDKKLRATTLTLVKYEDTSTRVATVPILDQGKLIGFVQFGHDLTDFQRLKETQQQTLLLFLPIVLAVSGGLGWFLADRALKPVRDITAAAQGISDENLGTRLQVNSSDELGRLASTFNGMLSRLEESFRLQRAALERQKQFVGDASHELRTPLARLRLTTSGAMEPDTTEVELREAITVADRETERMSKLVDEFLALARVENTSEVAYESMDWQELTAEIMDSVTEPHRVSVTPSELKLVGNQGEIHRAVLNLVTNALKFSPSNQKVELAIDQDTEQTIVRVTDHGSGIAPEHLSRLGERFYRVDESRNRALGGTGLGLALVKAIMEKHDGELKIDSKVGIGTTASLHFPKENRSK